MPSPAHAAETVPTHACRGVNARSGTGTHTTGSPVVPPVLDPESVLSSPLAPGSMLVLPSEVASAVDMPPVLDASPDPVVAPVVSVAAPSAEASSKQPNVGRASQPRSTILGRTSRGHAPPTSGACTRSLGGERAREADL